MSRVTIKLDRRFSKVVKGTYEKYRFEVGVLEDGPHKMPLPAKKGLKVVAGGPARKQSQVTSGLSLSDVSKEVRENTGVNYLTAPFKKKNSDIIKFTKSFFDYCQGRTQRKRCENLLQAIVRNPITRGDYGSNSPVSVKIKGFDRIMVDTGQLFKAIRARVKGKAGV